MSDLEEGICKGCGAPVYWIVGKVSKKKNIVERRRLAIITAEGELVYGYEPHWGNCPKADDFRKPKEGSK